MDEKDAEHAESSGWLDRRTLVGLAALTTVGLLAVACNETRDGGDGAAAPVQSPRVTATPRTSVPAVAATSKVLWHGSPKGRQIAWTVDDGYDDKTVAGYVAFAQQTGTPLTFLPNGAFQRVWNDHAKAVRPLIESGQVQFANHTFSHKNLVAISDKAIARQLTRNEDWIRRTFGTSSKPYLRPPYGSHNARTDRIAAELGYSSILLWNATLGDDLKINQKKLLRSARNGLKPGAIVVAHANHRAILSSFDDVKKIIRQRDLHPVTIDTMFGTTRPKI